MLSLVVFRPDASAVPDADAETFRPWFDTLVDGGRAMEVDVPGADAGASGDTIVLWCAVERRRFVDALFPTASFRRGLAPPLGAAPQAAVDADEAAAEAVRGSSTCAAR